jgi:predicted PurR-regulated permease PerM
VKRLASDRALAVSIVVLCLLVAGCVVVAAVAISNTNELADRTNGSLCALRHDLEQRVAGGEQFLREHPEGIPGIPAKTLQTSIDGQRRTIRALSNLKC